jgi:transcriptional regulator with XRE-family HTH domain
MFRRTRKLKLRNIVITEFRILGQIIAMDLAARRHANFLAWMAANGLNPNRIATRVGVTPSTINSYAAKPTASMKGDLEARIASAYGVSVEAIFGAAPVVDAELEPNHIGEWRAEAGLTVEDVAAALKTSVQVVLQLEAGEIDLTGKWMRRLAPLFGTNEGNLFKSPALAKSDIVALASTVPAENQQQAIKVLRTFTGTDG